MSLPKEERDYTYVDYLSWPKDERVEIINGTPYLQAAPSRIHQEILSEMHRQIANYLIDKNCKVYPAPFAVILDMEEKGDIKNVVEPDITIVCDEEKLDDRGCKGSPDMVVEITSPSTARRDKIEKFNLYEEAGIQEYWIIEPEEKILTVFTLQANQRYGRPNLYSEDDHAPVTIFDDLKINLNTVFSQ